jgi:PucR-like helix-turn-helix protein
VTALDHDLVGLLPQRPAEVPGVVVGVGPPARLAAPPAALAMAGRALQTALAFGETGVFAPAELGVRPAVLADDALGEAFVERHLAPLAALGRLGGELELTLRAWFEHGMRIDDTARALHMHPNTLRHRLRRFEEATGSVSAIPPTCSSSGGRWSGAGWARSPAPRAGAGTRTASRS